MVDNIKEIIEFNNVFNSGDNHHKLFNENGDLVFSTSGVSLSNESNGCKSYLSSDETELREFVDIMVEDYKQTLIQFKANN